MKRIVGLVITIVFVQLLSMCIDTDMIFASMQPETYSVLVKTGVLDDNSFSKGDVTRSQAVTTIMRGIGVTNDMDYKYYREVAYDKPVFVDYRSEKYSGFAILANFSKIAYGQPTLYYPTPDMFPEICYMENLFYPDRAATLQEVTAFMVRCLGDEAESLSEAYVKAKEIGLINPQDSFFAQERGTLTEDDFLTIFDRFLMQKRYKYFEEFKLRVNESEHKGHALKDNERSKTYLEHLQARISEKELTNP